jgi:hypothetical protein
MFKENQVKAWATPSEEDLLMIAVQLAEQLCKRYGLETLRKIDKANSLIPIEDDAVCDFIKPDEFFAEYVSACDALGFDSKNPHLVESFNRLREKGYEYFGDNYE